MGHDVTMPLSGTVCHRLRLATINPHTMFTHYEDIKGNTKCRNCGGLSPFDRVHTTSCSNLIEITSLSCTFSTYTFSTLTLFFGYQEEHLACKKFEQCGAGMVFCLERGANGLLTLLDVTTIPSSLASFKSSMVCHSGAGFPRWSWKRGR